MAIIKKANSFFFIAPLIFFVCSSMSAQSLKNSKVYILALISKTNLGDDNNSLAIYKALRKKLHEKKVPYASQILIQNKLDFSKIKESFKKSHSNFIIVLASGHKGIKSLVELKNRFSTIPVYSIWSGHQYFSMLTNYIRKINTIILPKSVLNNDEELKCLLDKHKNIFLFTTTLPTNLTEKELIDNFKENTDIIPKNKDYTSHVRWRLY
jgi:hypothetical protein